MAATQDESLIEKARLLALLSRHPAAGVFVHSDWGSQYTSDAYRALLAASSATASMSRTGNGSDNAVTESFFGTRDRANVSNALVFRLESRPGTVFLKMSSAFTIGFDDTRHSARSVRLPLSNWCVAPNV